MLSGTSTSGIYGSNDQRVEPVAVGPAANCLYAYKCGLVSPGFSSGKRADACRGELATLASANEPCPKSGIILY